MAVTVDLLRNVLTSKYLTLSGSTIAFHNIKYHSNNFHLFDNGPLRNLQVFSDRNKQFTLLPAPGQCNQGLTTHSVGSVIHLTPYSSTGVKVYVEDSSGDKYYLRINTAQSNTVELVCQSYVDSVSSHPYSNQELEFDLVTVNVDDF